MQGIIKINKQITKIKTEKRIKDCNLGKEPTLINTSEIEIKEKLGLRITTQKKAYSINYIEVRKEIK